MITRAQLRKLGDEPALYCLYGGRRPAHAAYVGIADRLRTRIVQHLVRRDSSVTTGVATVALNPELVTEIKWWRHARFSERLALQAAELIAFEVLNPVLRSRGSITREAETLSRQPKFRTDMKDLFRGPPEAALILPSMEVILDRLDELEERISRLEK
jgi:hypothetical protein